MGHNKVYYENPLIDKIIEIDEYGRANTEILATNTTIEDNYE